MGGRYIDLPADFNLQFIKKNAFFAFDDLECERSTTFSIPKTPNNMQIFGFANDFHRRGESMRVRVGAQMQNGIVVKDGYIYVSEYSDNLFECIFVTGDLLFLQRIRENGDWSNFIPSDIICDLNAEIKSAYDDNNIAADRFRYKTNGIVKPSWSLPTLAEVVCVNAGVNVDWGDLLQDVSGYRIIVGKPKGVPTTHLSLSRWFIDRPSESEPYPLENNVSMTGENTLDSVIVTDTSKKLRLVRGSFEQPIEEYGYVKQLVALQRINISFAEDTSEDIFLGTVNELGGVGFLGDYSFAKNSDGSVIVTGEPLAGRSIEIDAGQRFLLFTPDDLHSLADEPIAIAGWSISNIRLDCDVTISGADEQPANARIRAKDNVPAMTIVELLKVIAVLNGKSLSVNGDDAIVFVDDLLGNVLQDDFRVISWKNLTRTFADYAQHNLVRFESGELVQSYDRVEIAYTIDNVNIEIEKDLLLIPMSEGQKTDGVLVYIDKEFDGYTLSVCRNKEDMLQVTLPKNSSLQALCTASTSVVMRCRCNALQFEQMKYHTRVWFDGAEWVWVEMRWSGEIAEFVLSRI